MSGAVVAAAVARARQAIVRAFTEANATAPERAIAFTPRDRRLDRRVFSRMEKFGAVRETRPGHYWLDEARYADYRKENVARVLGIIGVMGLIAAGAIALGG